MAASAEQCLAAVQALAAQLDRAAQAGHVGAVPDRVLAVEVTDLGQVIVGSLRSGRLEDLSLVGPQVPDADATLRCTSDTLLALCAGELPFALAWASGRLAVEAGLRDLMRLRSLL